MIIPIESGRITYNAEKEKADNSLGKLIAEARNGKRLSLNALAKRLSIYGVDVLAAAVSKWEMGKSVPNPYQLAALAHALELEDDMNYFFRGCSELNAEGQKKLHDYKKDLVASGRYKPTTAQKAIRMIEMPVSELRASAGTGSFLDEGGFQKVKYPANQVPDGAEYGIYVSGDSMEPVYHDGQIVWVKECEELTPGDVGIFIYDGNGYIKSYDEQSPAEADCEQFTDSYGRVHMQSVLVSFNDKYAPIVVSPSEEFRIVGKVL